jgi:hypothetical protein
MKDLLLSRLRGAELRELVEELGEYSDRMLQDIVNSTIPGTDEDRNRGDSGAIITSNSIFGISFTTIFNILLVGAVVLIAWTYYKKNNK